uniref:Uncharacterized protein n=1 Tax=mine drainage metagenome TaxID=410659 RepID=E6QGE3_9ZZZZ
MRGTTDSGGRLNEKTNCGEWGKTRVDRNVEKVGNGLRRREGKPGRDGNGEGRHGGGDVVGTLRHQRHHIVVAASSQAGALLLGRSAKSLLAARHLFAVCGYPSHRQGARCRSRVYRCQYPRQQ